MTMRKVGNRLVWTHAVAPDPDFWNQWFAGNNNLIDRITKKLGSNVLDQYENPLLKYLPKEGKILEAGCGYGNILIPLLNMGYDIEGIEYSQELVAAINRAFPQLPIRCEDATEIKKPANYYAGYISLGVMEHLFDGPGPFLQESMRVLQPGGVVFISVPFYDLIWKMRSPWLPQGLPDAEDDERFFQWHFTRKEFATFVAEAGFEIIDMGSSGVRYGAMRSIPPWGWLQKKRGGHRLWKLLKFVEETTPWSGWMQWVVARKPA